MSRFAIETAQLTKTFGNREAVSNLSIEIEKGEIFSLLGTNGAGKTTTIKMLSCLLKPTSGSAILMGYDVGNDPNKIKEIIGISPQETAIAKHLNTLENLMLMGGIFGLNSGEAKERSQYLMNLMELEDRKDQARKLSGGMQRRLSIAMALMSDPQIIFLDEPTLGLDPHARRSVWNYIEKLKGEKTILLTTHYLEEADSLADRIGIMNEGQIIEMGTSHELKKRFQSKQILKVELNNQLSNISEWSALENTEFNFTEYGLEVKAANINFYEVMDLLRSKGASIKSIQMEEPTLDEVFLNLTGKEKLL